MRKCPVRSCLPPVITKKWQHKICKLDKQIWLVCGAKELFLKIDGSLPHRQVADGDKIELGQLIFTAYYTPGHTVGHVVYLLDCTTFGAPPSLFSGDHLFLGGIGTV